MATPLAGPLGRAWAPSSARLHTDHGTRLLCGIGVPGLEGSDRVAGVALADGRCIPADLCSSASARSPTSAGCHGSGLALGNGVVCDAGGDQPIPNIVAVGDCAAWLDEPPSGRHHRVEHWTGALERPASPSPPCSPAAPRTVTGRTAVLLVRPVRRPHPVRRHRPARRRGHRRGRRPARAQLPRDLPPRRRAGRRARHEPDQAVHPLAPPTGRSRPSARPDARYRPSTRPRRPTFPPASPSPKEPP